MALRSILTVMVFRTTIAEILVKYWFFIKNKWCVIRKAHEPGPSTCIVQQYWRISVTMVTPTGGGFALSSANEAYVVYFTQTWGCTPSPQKCAEIRFKNDVPFVHPHVKVRGPKSISIRPTLIYYYIFYVQYVQNNLNKNQ